MRKELSPFDHLKQNIVLFQKNYRDYSIRVKPISLTRDILIIHSWVNMDYAKTFWQMEGPYEKLYQHYEKFINDGHGFSLVFFINDMKTPVGLIDVYLARYDEIGKHYECGAEDYGLHILMAPKKIRIPGLTTNVLLTGLSFLFTLSIDRIIGEPDTGNKNANDLIKKAGFRFIKEVEMSYKKANLYFCDKKDFLREHPME